MKKGFKKYQIGLVLSTLALLNLSVIGYASFNMKDIKDESNTNDIVINVGSASKESISFSNVEIKPFSISSGGFYDSVNKTYSKSTAIVRVNATVTSSLTIDMPLRFTLGVSDNDAISDFSFYNLTNAIKVNFNSRSDNIYTYNSKTETELIHELAASKISTTQNTIPNGVYNLQMEYAFTILPSLQQSFTTSVFDKIYQSDLRFKLTIESIYGEK